MTFVSVDLSTRGIYEFDPPLSRLVNYPPGMRSYLNIVSVRRDKRMFYISIGFPVRQLQSKLTLCGVK